MKRITEYLMVYSDSTYVFHQDIEDALTKGFQPYGSPTTCFDVNGDPKCFSQAMVKYDEPVNTEGGEDA